MTRRGVDRAVEDDTFERERHRLLGLAYRMLGSVADAEDVVQDAWLRWQAADRATLARPEAWLTTVTTRVAMDRIRAQQRRRQTYVGPWLPDPLVAEPAATSPDPEASAELADSLTFGFLTVLDELGPVDRAVFLLGDVFAVPYAEIATMVGKSSAACRQIASRARVRMRASGVHRRVGKDRQLVDDLIAAIAIGDIDGVLRRLSPDAVCVSDGGANQRAARQPVVGAERVCRFLVNLARRFTDDVTFAPATINGDAGIIVSRHDAVVLVAAFEAAGELVVAIRIILNPDKLAHLRTPPELV